MENNLSQERVFKGVWIPAEIWEHPHLSWLQKCLWAEINSLGNDKRPCTASNEYLAAKMGSTVSSIANMISEFMKLGLVKKVGFDGRIRSILAVSDFTYSLTQGSPVGEVCNHSQVNKDTSRDTSTDNTPKSPSKSESRNYSGEWSFLKPEEISIENDGRFVGEIDRQRGKENRERLPRQKLTGKPNPKIAEEHNMLLQITSAWNAHGFPTKAEGITARRKRDLSKMLQQRPEFRDEWRDVMKVASESDFLMGRTEKNGKFSTWKFTLDNFLAHDFFLKIKEGKYTQEEDMSWAHRSL